MNDGMITTVPVSPLFFDFRHHEHPSVVHWKHDGNICVGDINDTSFFYITKGNVGIEMSDGTEFNLVEGWCGSVVGKLKIKGPGHALISTRESYKGLNKIVGPIEYRGRLSYIDGCSSTLLISAPKLGDPCFNFLHVPPGVDQTAHTHPTVRVGYIISGEGTVQLEDQTLVLAPGMIFCLLPDVIHSFHTKSSDLRIVIYHPDSDFGPSDEVHPMLNRTIVEGESASDLKKQGKIS